MEYKLGYFGLNKQSLKRKIKNVEGDRTKLNRLLNKRGTKYNLLDIKYIISRIYGDSTINENEPLSVYYSKQNANKYKDLMDMIEIIEKDNVDEKIEQEIKELHDKTFEQIDRNQLEKRFDEISKKYSLTLKEVERQYLEFEESWIEKIN